MTSLEKAKIIAKTLDDKKALDVNVLKVEQSSSVWEYFVIATGETNTHIKALANIVEEKMENMGERPLHVEGYVSCEWVLMDYADVNVNIFQEESRMFYSLERLWQDCEQIDFDD